MSTVNMPLYRLLIKLGAVDAEAETAASFDASGLATKQDITTALAEFEARLAWKIGTLIVGAMVSMTGIFAIIVGWLVRRP